MGRRLPVRRRAVYREIKGQLHKLCTGPLHEEGEWVPSPDGFYQRVRKGQKMDRPECKACEAHRRGTSKYVPFHRVKFALTELQHRLGIAETARRIHVAEQTIWKYNNGKTKFVQRRTAVKIFTALADVRAKGEVRHRDSIHYGSAFRGLKEKEIHSPMDFYKPHGDSQRAQAKKKRERLNAKKLKEITQKDRTQMGRGRTKTAV